MKMSKQSWPKIFRDPIHNIISFEDNDCDKLLLGLIDTKEFQRLRRIKQLGMCDLVFPGANHSRFAHSLGVMHVARMMLNRIGRLMGSKLTEEHRKIVLVSALLHDIGHGPYSHAFESVTGISHEEWTRKIILDESTGVNKVLSKDDREMPAKVAAFFLEIPEEDNDQNNLIPPYLEQIVSSQLDADRFDFLLRDSHATGTEYGYYDLEWLIKHIHINENKKRLYLDRKAILAVTNYIFARFHMYQAVYYHKATRAAELMLKLILKRYKDMIDQEDTEEKKKAVAPGVSINMIHSFSGKLSLKEFLFLDDNSVIELIKACADSSDTILKMIGNGITDRILYKCVDMTTV